MIPNTIPAGYVQKPSLQLPLTIENHKFNPWPLYIAAALAILFLLIYPHSNGFVALVILFVICPAFFLLCIFIILKFFETPPNKVLIESTQITVRSIFGSSQVYSVDKLDYIALYTDRYFPDNSRPFLFFFNLEQGRSSSFLESIISSFVGSSLEWAFLTKLDKVKVVIHIKDCNDIILFEVPDKDLSPTIRDLGLLLKIPVKL